MKEQQPIWLPRARCFIGLVCCILLPALGVAAPSVTQLPATATGSEIQQALDALPAEGGEVRLAPGSYEIRQPLVLNRDRQTLRGSGPETVLWLAAGANCPVILLGSTEANPANKARGLRLADLTIDGNRAEQQFEAWQSPLNTSHIQNNGVMVQAVTDTVVERVVVKRCRSGGLVTANGVRRLTVTDFEASDNEFDGLACYLTEESVFTRMNLHNNVAAGISLDLAFNHNIISDAILANNDLGIFMRHSSSNSFTRLTIRQQRNDGVFIAQAGGDTPTGWQFTPGTECVANSFTASTVSDCGGVGIRVNDVSCVGNTVRDVTFTNCARGNLVGIDAGLAKLERELGRE